MTLQVGELFATLGLDDKPFQRGLDDAGGPRGLGRLNGMVKGAAVAMGGALAGIGLAKLGADLFKTGQATEILGKKSATVFEGSIGDVKKWAAQNAQSFGLTRSELTGMAAGFGDLLKPMGFTAKEAAGMSKDVIGLSGALAAWSGGKRSTVEVSEILASAMLGERDALKSLGISITEADVQAQLAAKGHEKLTGAALEQAKALATQDLIFAKSTDAQNAWAAGGGRALGASNRLKAGLGEIKESLSTALLPAMTKGVELASVLLPKAFEKAKQVLAPVGELFAKFGRTLSGIGDKGAGLVINIASLFGIMEDDARLEPFFAAMERAEDVIGAVIAFVRDHARPILIGLGATFLLLTSPVTAVIAGLVVAYVKFEAFRKVVDTVARFLVQRALPAVKALAAVVVEQLGNAVEWVRRMWPQISEAIRHVFNVVSAVVSAFVAGAKVAWALFADDIMRILGGVFDALKGVIEGALGIVRGIIQTVLAVINGDWGKAWDGLKEIVDGAWTAIKAVVGGAFDVLSGWFGGFADAVGAVWSGLWDGIKAKAKAGWDWLAENVLNPLIDAINTVIRGMNAVGWGKDIPSLKRIKTEVETARPIPAGGGAGRIAVMHSGGTFRAPRPGGEGLALLRDGERVTPAGQEIDYDRLGRAVAANTGGIRVDRIDARGARYPEETATAIVRRLRQRAFLGR